MSAIGRGSVYHRGFGIKKRSWFGGCSRPAFMEPLVGVPPPRDGNYVRLVGGGGGLGGGGGGGVGMRRSSFPIKDDAEYIGYLSDDGGSGDDIISVVHRRRRELLGPDISFTMCCLLVLMVMMVMMVMVWGFRWGFRPPATGSSGVAVNIDRR